MACAVKTRKYEDYKVIASEATPSRVLLATFCVNADMIFSLPLNDETRTKLLLLYDKYCKPDGISGE